MSATKVMNNFRNEWIYFWTAVMFFTRIPVPFLLPYSSEIMNQSQKYYTWVGLLIGIINAFVFGACTFIFSVEISIIISMIFSVLLTGAFHEDGFTDVCDSFGGGYGKEKIMTIMKDSRIGAYGVIGITLLLTLKFLALSEIARFDIVTACFVIVTGHTVSRFISSTMIYTHQYVTDIDVSKSKPIATKALPIFSLFVGFIAVILPFYIFQEWKYLPIIAFAYSGKVYLGWYFNKHIGGYTGDCLGSVQQVTEVLWYLGGIVIWKFI